MSLFSGMAAAAAVTPLAAPASSRSTFSSDAMKIATKERKEFTYSGESRCKPVATKKRPPFLPPLCDDAHEQFAQLMEKVMREAGVDWDHRRERQVLSESCSAPSTPRKVIKRMIFKEDAPSENVYNSSSTLTSEEDGSPQTTRRDIPSVVISNEDSFDAANTEQSERTHEPKRERTGSQFYHMSFSSHQHDTPQSPVMYIPPSTPCQEQRNGKGSKLKRRFGKLRSSTKSSQTANKLVITRVPSSPATKTKPMGWVDYEDDLEPVSKPSYFRHIGRIVGTGPGAAYTVELNKPSQGKLGIYIVQGFDKGRQSRSVYISRFYQQNAEKFYAGLVHPGDELIAVENSSVREKTVSEVQQMIAGLETVRLTVLPVTCVT